MPIHHPTMFGESLPPREVPPERRWLRVGFLIVGGAGMLTIALLLFRVLGR